MKVVIYQSYRTRNVAPWISECLESVRQWTRNKGYHYCFFDDALFDLVPEWFREKVQHKILPMSDLGRLYAARQLLAESFDVAVWMDADLYIYDRFRFEVNLAPSFSLTKEVWITSSLLPGRPQVWVRICNAVMVYHRENPFLDFYIYGAEETIRNRGHWVERLRGSNDLRYLLFDLKNRIRPLSDELPEAVIGTMFLTALYKMFPFPVIGNIGLFSPALLGQIALGKEAMPRRYMQMFSEPLYAANLCGSFYGKKAHGVMMDDALYRDVMDRLASSKGEVLNRFLSNKTL